MGLSLAERFAMLPAAKRAAWLDTQPTHILEEIARGEWWWMSRPEQVPPPGDWFIYLALAGRGWGKSRSGSEWLVEQIVKHPFDRYGVPTEWLIAAETLSDARLICLEGPAGVLRVLERRRIIHKYKQSPRPMVVFPDGAKIYCEGADDADVGRGYNLSGSWMDESAKWRTPYNSWYEGIMPSLRADLIGDHPRSFATTTPKPDKLLRDWVNRRDGTVVVVRGSTFDNASNLSAHVLAELRSRYEGTAIGRQELYGEMLEGLDGALFSRLVLEATRVVEAPDDLVSIVVGVDPSLTGVDDEMGVVVVGRTKDDDLWVLADRSTDASGREAAHHVWRTVFEFGADLLLYESNLGKRWMADVLRDAYFELVANGEIPRGTTPPMKDIDTKIGKKTRAEPVAMRWEQKRAHLVGNMPTLENQMCEFVSWDGRESPDRLDALVHACRHLMASGKSAVRMASPADYAQDLYHGLNSYDTGLGLF